MKRTFHAILAWLSVAALILPILFATVWTPKALAWLNTTAPEGHIESYASPASLADGVLHDNMTIYMRELDYSTLVDTRPDRYAIFRLGTILGTAHKGETGISQDDADARVDKYIICEYANSETVNASDYSLTETTTGERAPDTNTVALYQFNESDYSGTDSEVVDTGINHYSGKAYNGVTTSSVAPFGRSLNLKADNDQVRFSDVAASQIAQKIGAYDHTWEFWLKLSALGSGRTDSLVTALTVFTMYLPVNPVAGEVIMVSGGTTTTVQLKAFYVYPGGGSCGENTRGYAVVADLNWHHYAFTTHIIDGSNTTVRTYVDGILTYTSTGMYRPNSAYGTGIFAIGSPPPYMGSTSLPYATQGYLDDLVFSDTVLSETTIEADATLAFSSSYRAAYVANVTAPGQPYALGWDVPFLDDTGTESNLFQEGFSLTLKSGNTYQLRLQVDDVVGLSTADDGLDDDEEVTFFIPPIADQQRTKGGSWWTNEGAFNEGRKLWLGANDGT